MPRQSYIRFVWAVSGLMLLSLLAYGVHFNFEVSGDPGHWGNLGDFFGGLWNPLLSFLALLILVRTLRETMAAGEAAGETARAAREQLQLARRTRCSLTPAVLP